MSKNLHTPVLLDSIIDNIKQNSVDFSNKIAFDGTFGGGGYSQKLAEIGMQVFASDMDEQAILNFSSNFESNFESNLKDNQKNFSLKILNKNNFYKNLENYPFKQGQILVTQNSFSKHIKEFPNNFFDFIILDLGFSSNQLEYSNRGFSYQKTQEILDLRYDSSFGSPCWRKIQHFKKPEEFYKILYLYSGEKLSKPISDNLNKLVRSKKNEEVVLVGEVVEVIKSCIPHRYMKNFRSILSRIWQALRIWTNREMEELEIFLEESIIRLKPKGLLIIVDFHSLEDKMVTNFMRNLAKSKIIDEFGNKKTDFKLLTPKAILPTSEEIDQNIRSRSSKLRILQKL
jgi:16S rRNA (cytosine1402-N4)-methyltransferase